MLSNYEVWTGFVKRVLGKRYDKSTAMRLHQGHDLIFGKKCVPTEAYELPMPEATKDDSDSKKIISMLEQILEALKHEKD